MIEFIAAEWTWEINFPYEVTDFTYSIEFNGTGNNDTPDEPPSLDNGNENPFDHAYHGEEE